MENQQIQQVDLTFYQPDVTRGMRNLLGANTRIQEGAIVGAGIFRNIKSGIARFARWRGGSVSIKFYLC